MNHRPFSQRILIAILGFFAAVVVVGSPLVTHRVHAQLSVVVTESIPDKTNDVLDEIFQALSQAAVTAFFNAARTFAGQIAYDAANYLASGGTGQGALAFEKGFGAYLEDVGQDAAGEFIGSLVARIFSGCGFRSMSSAKPGSIVQPPDFDLQLNPWSRSFSGRQDCNNRPRPRCDFQEIVSNYENLYTTLSNAEITDFVSASFNTNCKRARRKRHDSWPLHL
jgi:hypothetical protein